MCAMLNTQTDMIHLMYSLEPGLQTDMYTQPYATVAFAAAPYVQIRFNQQRAAPRAKQQRTAEASERADDG